MARRKKQIAGKSDGSKPPLLPIFKTQVVSENLHDARFRKIAEGETQPREVGQAAMVALEAMERDKRVIVGARRKEPGDGDVVLQDKEPWALDRSISTDAAMVARDAMERDHRMTRPKRLGGVP